MYDICLNLWDPAKLSQPTTEKNEKKKKKKKKHSTQTDRARKKDCGSNLWRLKSVSLLQLRPWSLPSQVAGARQLARSMSNGDLLQLWYESPSDKWKPFFTVTTFWKLLSSKLAFLMILMLGREDEASKRRVWRGCAWEETGAVLYFVQVFKGFKWTPDFFFIYIYIYIYNIYIFLLV